MQHLMVALYKESWQSLNMNLDDFLNVKRVHFCFENSEFHSATLSNDRYPYLLYVFNILS